MEMGDGRRGRQSYSLPPDTYRLQPTRRISGAESFVAGDTGSPADAQLDQRTTLGAKLGLLNVFAPIGNTLAVDAPFGVRKDFYPLSRDRLFADFANDHLLPIAPAVVLDRLPYRQTHRSTNITLQAAGMSGQQFRNQIGRRIGGSSQQT